MSNKRRILFLCTTNSCRSQMAEGIVKYFYGDQFDVESAGSKITPVHPFTIKVMAEIGIDITRQRSKLVTEFAGQEFDYVITLCGGYSKTTCPVFLGKAKQELHWDFIDPADAKGSEEEILDVFRKVRDEIKSKISEFVEKLDK
jgi:arsenate reductase (thioredoxin)